MVLKIIDHKGGLKLYRSLLSPPISTDIRIL